MVARVVPLGGILVSLTAPDRRGRLDDVVLGHDSLGEYARDPNYFGALVGRYANRIARGAFALDGARYALAINDPPNHLHGGPGGFHRATWRVTPSADGRGAALAHDSPDGDGGYPGALSVRVTYTLDDDGTFAADYRATTTRATPVNLSQHAYFNLAGHGAGDVLGHELALNASRFTPVDGTMIPTGELRPVAGTPFDFSAPRAIGDAIDADDEQLRHAGGYDHNFVVDRGGAGADALVLAARLRDPRSGRTLEVHTTEPGIQLYSGNLIPRGTHGKSGARYDRRGGVALETQHFPDSPNHPHFPSTILRPGEEYRSRTEYRFTAV